MAQEKKEIDYQAVLNILLGSLSVIVKMDQDFNTKQCVTRAVNSAFEISGTDKPEFVLENFKQD